MANTAANNPKRKLMHSKYTAKSRKYHISGMANMRSEGALKP